MAHDQLSTSQISSLWAEMQARRREADEKLNKLVAVASYMEIQSEILRTFWTALKKIYLNDKHGGRDGTEQYLQDALQEMILESMKHLIFANGCYLLEIKIPPGNVNLFKRIAAYFTGSLRAKIKDDDTGKIFVIFGCEDSLKQ